MLEKRFEFQKTGGEMPVEHRQEQKWFFNGKKVGQRFNPKYQNGFKMILGALRYSEVASK